MPGVGGTPAPSQQARAGEEHARQKDAEPGPSPRGRRKPGTEQSHEPPGGEGEATASEQPERRPSQPSGPIHVRYYGLTDVGQVRDHNEDNFLVADLDSDLRDLPSDEVQSFTLGPHGAIFAVCDGMGGAAAGEVASQMAVDTLYEVMRQWEAPQDRDVFAHHLVRAIEIAGQRIFGAAKMDRSRRGMGTTATVAGLVDEVLFVGQVGDSRAYLLRGGKLGLVTKDQSLVNKLIEAGHLTEEEAEQFEHANIILQALGTTEHVDVDLSFVRLCRGDRLMLCSDGLSGLVHEEIIREVLQQEKDPKRACERLVELANQAGGHDNVTVVVVDFDGEGLRAADDAITPVYQQYPLPPFEEPTPIRRLPLRATPRKLSDVRNPSVPLHKEPAWWSRLWMWIVPAGLLGVLVALLVRASTGPPGQQVPPEHAGPPRSETTSPASGLEKRYPVDVSSDIPGAILYIDEERIGTLRAHPQRVELPAGVYRFEARTGEQTVVTQQVRVPPDAAGPLRIVLSLPKGQAPPAGGSGAPGDTGAEAASPAPDATAPGAEPAPSGPPRPAESGTAAGAAPHLQPPARTEERSRPPQSRAAPQRQPQPPSAQRSSERGPSADPRRHRTNRRGSAASSSPLPDNPF